jgi:hypothetical protein
MSFGSIIGFFLLDHSHISVQFVLNSFLLGIFLGFYEGNFMVLLFLNDFSDGISIA